MNTLEKLFGAAARSVPPKAIRGGVAWCERFVRLPGSARGEQWRSEHTPWTRQPLEDAVGGNCKIVTFVAPIQSGKSAAGEAAICYWIGNESGGNIQYNWEDNQKALERWDDRFERILLECDPVMAKAPSRLKSDGRWKRGKVLFSNFNFEMQGSFSAKNLDSDTVRFQINEELHNWIAGRMSMAYGRTTAVWNAVIFNISNAGETGSQLHEAFLAGTQQHWEVLCPGCGKHHRMRTQWNPKAPELGGLRYDADGCRLGNGHYDYRKLEPTIFYQFPCGHSIRDEKRARRQMSIGGRYGEPINQGAPLWERSYTLEAVAIDYIPWLKLIQEKHAALRAMKLGDPEQWWTYLQRRESQFIDKAEDRPIVGQVVLNAALKKDRAGLKNRIARFGALDHQQGSIKKGEFPHWWGVIRDFDEKGNSMLVWEGKLLDDEAAAEIMFRHEVRPNMVVVDSGDAASLIYQFCLKHGFNAIKGAPDAGFHHKQGGWRIFSREKALHKMLGMPSKFGPLEAPMFWHYSKSGIRERLHWMRSLVSPKWEVPGDVSDDYQKHFEAEELQERIVPRTGETVTEFVQVKRRNDLYVCEAYIAMLADMAGIVGSMSPVEKDSEKTLEKLKKQLRVKEILKK